MNDGALTEESDVEADNCEKANRAWEVYSESGTVGMDKMKDLCNLGEIIDQANGLVIDLNSLEMSLDLAMWFYRRITG